MMILVNNNQLSWNNLPHYALWILYSETAIKILSALVNSLLMSHHYAPDLNNAWVYRVPCWPLHSPCWSFGHIAIFRFVYTHLPKLRDDSMRINSFTIDHLVTSLLVHDSIFTRRIPLPSFPLLDEVWCINSSLRVSIVRGSRTPLNAMMFQMQSNRLGVPRWD